MSHRAVGTILCCPMLLVTSLHACDNVLFIDSQQSTEHDAVLPYDAGSVPACMSYQMPTNVWPATARNPEFSAADWCWDSSCKHDPSNIIRYEHYSSANDFAPLLDVTHVPLGKLLVLSHCSFDTIQQEFLISLGACARACACVYVCVLHLVNTLHAGICWRLDECGRAMAS